ncbi:MAG: ABC transporter permease, partial [Nocardiopsis sp. BM-2018]
MRGYIIRRCLYMVPTLFAISVVAFLVIQLPPGNFLTAYIAQLSAQGQG